MPPRRGGKSFVTSSVLLIMTPFMIGPVLHEREACAAILDDDSNGRPFRL